VAVTERLNQVEADSYRTDGEDTRNLAKEFGLSKDDHQQSSNNVNGEGEGLQKMNESGEYTWDVFTVSVYLHFH
jgi:hypothetical protein